MARSRLSSRLVVLQVHVLVLGCTRAQLEATTRLEQMAMALELQPTSAAAHSNYGIALKSEGRAAEALGWFDKAVSLDPQYGRAYLSMANALQTLNGDATQREGAPSEPPFVSKSGVSSTFCLKKWRPSEPDSPNPSSARPPEAQPSTPDRRDPSSVRPTGPSPLPPRPYSFPVADPLSPLPPPPAPARPSPLPTPLSPPPPPARRLPARIGAKPPRRPRADARFSRGAQLAREHAP